MVWRLSGNENMWIILTPSITGFSEAYGGWEPHGSSMLTLWFGRESSRAHSSYCASIARIHSSNSLCILPKIFRIMRIPPLEPYVQCFRACELAMCAAILAPMMWLCGASVQVTKCTSSGYYQIKVTFLSPKISFNT